MKVYLLMELDEGGEYTEYGIEGIYATRALAEAAMEKNGGQRKCDEWYGTPDKYEIHEREVVGA